MKRYFKGQIEKIARDATEARHFLSHQAENLNAIQHEPSLPLLRATHHAFVDIHGGLIAMAKIKRRILRRGYRIIFGEVSV